MLSQKNIYFISYAEIQVKLEMGLLGTVGGLLNTVSGLLTGLPVVGPLVGTVLGLVGGIVTV